MWPFRKKRSREPDALAVIDAGIEFASERWRFFSRSIEVAPATSLRDRIGLFARSFEPSLHARHPSLAAAPAEVILLIVAKGVEQSGTVSRGDIERALGILLPP
jgi:hypothetical protein